MASPLDLPTDAAQLPTELGADGADTHSLVHAVTHDLFEVLVDSAQEGLTGRSRAYRYQSSPSLPRALRTYASRDGETRFRPSVS